MIEAKENSRLDCYFAASNSFLGFRNHFQEVFNPKKFDRLFLLKGGPGTGKSSLMKRVLGAFLDTCLCEAIYCSSDNKSLDGVIFETEKGRVAVFDSTPPHLDDPRLPGAIDEIVNIGDGWDRRSLTAHKEEIIELNEKKSELYQSAYAFLNMCGAIKSEKRRIIKRLYDNSDERVINELLSKITNIKYSRKKETRLLSSFSKDGYYTLKQRKIDIEITVLGENESKYIFLDKLVLQAEKCGFDCVKFPSPLSSDYTDAVLIGNAFLSINHTFENVISTDSLVTFDNEYERKTLQCLEKHETELLTEAQRAFSLAFDYHISLEKIYTANMNFDRNLQISEYLISSIREIIL